MTMLRKFLRCFVVFAAWTSVHAAESTEILPIPIGAYRHYVLLPVTAPELKPHRGLLPNISDRMFGRMAPLLNEWNYTDKVAKIDTELAIALVIDKSRGVSGGARVMWGPFAGGSDVAAHVDLIERPSGKVVGQQTFFVVGKTSGTASDYLLYDDLVSQVVSYLSSCYSMHSKNAAVETIKP